MVKLIVVFSAALLMGLFLQATLVHSFFPSAIAPDFVLILAFYLGLFFKSPGGAVGAFTLGAAADFASGVFVGPNAAGCAVAFYFVAMLSGHMFAEKGVVAALLCFFASLVKSLVYVAILTVYAGAEMSGAIFGIMFGEAVFTGILAPVVVKLLGSGRSGYMINQLEIREAYRR